MEVLTFENLSFKYPQTQSFALCDISFRLEKGNFALLCGPTGSGKSTLLRLIPRALAPKGDMQGGIRFMGENLYGSRKPLFLKEIGFVGQHPEAQIVTDKVWHELAFGLENQGLPTPVIRRRVAETACFFGIEPWFDKDVHTLSGGQKQLLCLASVMAMQPKLLILDEPTAQLDPISAGEFIAALSRLNRELALTILMAEHRLEEAIPVSDKVFALEKGKLVEGGDTRAAVARLKTKPLFAAGMPAAVRLYSSLEVDAPCPLTVREGRDFIEENFENSRRLLPRKPKSQGGSPALEFSKVYFRYSRENPDVLCGLDLKAAPGEILCILGGNGSGKTTALNCGAGLNTPYAGSIKVFGKKIKDYKGRSLYTNCLALLPQDVSAVFLRETVREELKEAGVIAGALPYDFSPLLDKHPYDLSGGEKQLLALAIALSAKPRILLLDEPTKGLDAHSKNKIAELLKTLRDAGAAVVVATHDVEFAAGCADQCALFFRGGIAALGETAEFFDENNFYTTAANRMTRGYYDGMVTVADAAKLCALNTRRTKKP